MCVCVCVCVVLYIKVLLLFVVALNNIIFLNCAISAIKRRFRNTTQVSLKLYLYALD